MNERETKIVKTPVKAHEVVLKSWINGREKRALRDIFLQNIKVSTKGTAEAEANNSAEVVNRAENKAIEIVVVSINNKTDKILDTILDMCGKDYDFVIDEINKVTREDDFLE